MSNREQKSYQPLVDVTEDESLSIETILEEIVSADLTRLFQPQAPDARQHVTAELSEAIKNLKESLHLPASPADEKDEPNGTVDQRLPFQLRTPLELLEDLFLWCEKNGESVAVHSLEKAIKTLRAFPADFDEPNNRDTLTKAANRLTKAIKALGKTLDPFDDAVAETDWLHVVVDDPNRISHKQHHGALAELQANSFSQSDFKRSQREAKNNSGRCQLGPNANGKTFIIDSRLLSFGNRLETQYNLSLTPTQKIVLGTLTFISTGASTVDSFMAKLATSYGDVNSAPTHLALPNNYPEKTKTIATRIISEAIFTTLQKGEQIFEGDAYTFTPAFRDAVNAELTTPPSPFRIWAPPTAPNKPSFWRFKSLCHVFYQCA